MVAAKAPAEARHIEVVLHHRLALLDNCKIRGSAGGAAVDAGKLHADFIDAVLKRLPAVRIIDFPRQTWTGWRCIDISIRPYLVFTGRRRRGRLLGAPWTFKCGYDRAKYFNIP